MTTSQSQGSSKSIPELQKELDKVFSRYIRLRDTDSSGLIPCISCGRRLEYRHMQCGHFVGRGSMALRYDPLNCWSQCSHCNCYLGGNLAEYEKMLRSTVARLFPGRAEELIGGLMARRTAIMRFNRGDYEEMIDYFSKATELLEKIHRLGHPVPAEFYLLSD